MCVQAIISATCLPRRLTRWRTRRVSLCGRSCPGTGGRSTTQKNGAPTLGQRCYTKLADEFACSDSAHHQWAVADKTRAVCTGWIRSHVAVHQHPRSCDAAMEYLEHAALTNQKTDVLLFRQVPPVLEVAAAVPKSWLLTWCCRKRIDR